LADFNLTFGYVVFRNIEGKSEMVSAGLLRELLMPCGLFRLVDV